MVCAQLLVPAGDALRWPEVGHKCNELGSLTSGLLSPASDFHLGLTNLSASELRGKSMFFFFWFLSLFSDIGTYFPTWDRAYPF